MTQVIVGEVLSQIVLLTLVFFAVGLVVLAVVWLPLTIADLLVDAGTFELAAIACSPATSGPSPLPRR